VLLAAGAATWALLRQPVAAPAQQPAATTTAVVTRGDVAQRVPVPGFLDYDGEYTVTSQLPAGVLTAVAEPGSAVVRGADLFTVAGTAAVLLYGPVPAWRDMVLGMSDGADVQELETNLVALGMDPDQTITVDSHFTAATAAAVRRWQAARGLPTALRTGEIALGEVVFLPGAIRVRQTPAAIGTLVSPNTTVVLGSSTNRVVHVDLTTDKQSLVHVGDSVDVGFAGLTDDVRGTVLSVGTVAVAPSQGNGPATVPVVISLTMPPGTADLDHAPVQVSITTATHHGVLMVPVLALLAKPGGGYQVAVVDSAARQLITVTPGLYDDRAGTVEVTGDGLAEGDVVEVPAS
jgi:peptidoglycan hydrolase-like protein with peptidoglycan-binding domain